MIRHSRVELRTGICMHVAEAVPPQGAPRGTVLCVHGFPDTWYGWRKQMLPLANAGFRVLVPDMRGYGETTPVLRSAGDYCMENNAEDLIALLDALLLDKVFLAGHDYGGTTVWNTALHHPERVLAVMAFCTPFFAWKPNNPWPTMQAKPGRFDYQMYFQTKEAELEFERDYERTVKCMIRGTSDSDLANAGDAVKQPMLPTKQGGMLVNFPDDLQRSEMLTQTDVEYYAESFRRTGFFGILGWYRNVETNWKWNASTEGKKIEVPCLMVTASRDLILPPSMAETMHEWIDDLVVVNVSDAGHWVLQEQSEQCNTIMTGFLDSKFPPTKKKGDRQAKL